MKLHIDSSYCKSPFWLQSKTWKSEDRNFICGSVTDSLCDSWQINLTLVTELGKQGQAERLGVWVSVSEMNQDIL